MIAPYFPRNWTAVLNFKIHLGLLFTWSDTWEMIVGNPILVTWFLMVMDPPYLERTWLSVSASVSIQLLLLGRSLTNSQSYRHMTSEVLLHSQGEIRTPLWLPIFMRKKKKKNLEEMQDRISISLDYEQSTESIMSGWLKKTRTETEYVKAD